MIIFSTERYDALAAAVAAATQCPHGAIERSRFPDGERYQRIVTDVAGREVALVGGTISDEDTLELYDLGCALAQHGARRLHVVIPYFGYATMERMVRPGEVVTAKARARLLSSLPVCRDGNEVTLLDAHTEGLPYYFEGAVRAVHLYAKPVILEAARRLGGGGSDFVLGCTDAGRAKWVQSLANELGVPAAFVFKRRTSGSSTEVTAVSAQVDGRTVVIYDDMIRTGGSLLHAAEAYRQSGARTVAALATHGLFPGDALARLAGSGTFAAIVTTDSHPRAVELAQHEPRLEVVTVAGLLGEHLARMRS